MLNLNIKFKYINVEYKILNLNIKHNVLKFNLSNSKILNHDFNDNDLRILPRFWSPRTPRNFWRELKYKNLNNVAERLPRSSLN